MSSQNADIVLVHGAWADGSGWAKVIAPLTAAGFSVAAAPLPLTSFAEDIAALDRTLERTEKPVVLVGHRSEERRVGKEGQGAGLCRGACSG